MYVEPPPPFTVQVNSQDQDVEMESVHDNGNDDSNGNDEDDDNDPGLEVIIGPQLEVPLSNQDAQEPPNKQGREQGGPEDPIDLSLDDSSAEELNLSEQVLLREFGREVAGYIADAEGIHPLYIRGSALVRFNDDEIVGHLPLPAMQEVAAPDF